MDANTVIPISFTLTQIQLVAGALAKLSYEESAATIQSIQGQVTAYATLEMAQLQEQQQKEANDRIDAANAASIAANQIDPDEVAPPPAPTMKKPRAKLRSVK